MSHSDANAIIESLFTKTCVTNSNAVCSLQVKNNEILSSHSISALCSALNVGVRVEYMDRGEAEGGQVTAHEFPDGLKPKVYLLYRPGHYDILYPQ